MGNCVMKTPRTRELEEEEIVQQLEEIEKGNGVKKGSMKVKIVLTKEQLELFLLKLKKNNGGKRRILWREWRKLGQGKLIPGDLHWRATWKTNTLKDLQWTDHDS